MKEHKHKKKTQKSRLYDKWLILFIEYNFRGWQSLGYVYLPYYLFTYLNYEGRKHHQNKRLPLCRCLEL